MFQLEDGTLRFPTNSCEELDGLSHREFVWDGLSDSLIHAGVVAFWWWIRFWWDVNNPLLSEVNNWLL